MRFDCSTTIKKIKRLSERQVAYIPFAVLTLGSSSDELSSNMTGRRTLFKLIILLNKAKDLSQKSSSSHSNLETNLVNGVKLKYRACERQ